MNLNHDIEEKVRKELRRAFFAKNSYDLDVAVKKLTRLFEEHSKERVRQALKRIEQTAVAVGTHEAIKQELAKEEV